MNMKNDKRPNQLGTPVAGLGSQVRVPSADAAAMLLAKAAELGGNVKVAGAEAAKVLSNAPTLGKAPKLGAATKLGMAAKIGATKTLGATPKGKPVRWTKPKE